AYNMEPHLLKLSKQLCRIRETIAVPGENPVSIQAVYVKVKGIAGNITLAKRARNLPDFICRFIPETALSVDQPPQRRKRLMNQQVPVKRQNSLRRRPAEHIINQVAIACPEP